MKTEEILKKLSEMRGISGHEFMISDEIAKMFKPYADDVFIDKLGNVIAVKKCGRENAKSILLDAHMDEIGMMVSNIDPRGFIKFVPIGGMDKRTLLGSRVTIHTKTGDIVGVIGSKPPHLLPAAQAKVSVQIIDMAIDVGLSVEEAKAKITIGDPITMDQEAFKLGSSMFSGKSLDDRAAITAILLAFIEIENYNLDVDVYAVCSVQEEVGIRGAMVAGYSIYPDMAIVIDVCHGITPDNSKEAFEIGKGPVLTVGPNIHPKAYECLKNAAEKYHISYDIEVCGGSVGTNSWAYQVSRGGVATALIGLPLKYMHSTIETLAISDVEDTARLIAFTLKDIKADFEIGVDY